MLVRSKPEERSRFYGDVEDLIAPGFLSHTIELGGVRFGLRSLGPGDFFLIRNRAGSTHNRDWQVWVIASSIWLFNGYNTLAERNFVPRLAESIRLLPRTVTDILFSVILGLYARQERAAEGIEAFVYEDRSRGLWRMLGKQGLHRHSGVPGSELIGTNYLQRLWIAFNEAEDERLQAEREWEGFKFVASAQSPKGVKKIDQKDAKMRTDETNRRQAVMDRYYYYRSGLVDREGFLKDRNRDMVGARLTQPKSVEDLEQEFERWVKGDQDEHDQIVEGYKAMMVARREKETQEREERRRRLLEEDARREEADLRPMPLVGYTPEQLSEILRQRGTGRPGIRQIYDDDAIRHQAYADRFLKQKQKAGRLAVAGGKVIDPDANPEADQRTLDEMVRGRAVPFSPNPLLGAGDGDDEEKVSLVVLGGGRYGGR